jgi:hypothetical protein
MPFKTIFAGRPVEAPHGVVGIMQSAVSEGLDISSIQNNSGRLKDFSPERGHSSRHPRGAPIGLLPRQRPRNLAGNTEKHDGNVDLRVRFDHHCHPGFGRCHGRRHCPLML